MNYVLLACASFIFVALKAFQQLNVMHDRTKWVLPTSMLMACMEVSIIIGAISNGWRAAIPMGIGGGLGCLAAMRLHKRMRK
jgi:hypothetical protein